MTMKLEEEHSDVLRRKMAYAQQEHIRQTAPAHAASASWLSATVSWTLRG
jgi:hypothetical protein